MSDTDEFRSINDCIGRDALDAGGDRIGKVYDVYADDDTGRPEWLAIETGLFGRSVSFVPLTGASFTGDQITVAWDKAVVKDAPRAEADGQLSEEEEARLYQHYGLGYSEARSDSGLPAGGTDAAATGGDTAAVTRSEEELQVDKTERESGRVRLRKWVETEHVEVTVPVRREMARVVREPATGNEVIGDLGATAEEIVLSEEVPVVDTRVVPKETVRLETETVVEERRVGADLDKERIEVEGDVEGDVRGGDARP